MRLLNADDFQATGWRVSDAKVGPLVEGIVNTQADAFAKFGITEDLMIVHLMAQISHESGEGGHLTESLNYQPAALLKLWPTHFTPELAMSYGRTDQHPADQKMIAQLAYGGRMGNGAPPSSDGYDFRGRGFIQTTGRNNYTALSQKTGLDLVNNPDWLIDPQYAFICAVAEFATIPGMLDFCMSDDLLAVSSLVNVGHRVTDPSKVIGYQERQAQLTLWKHQYDF